MENDTRYELIGRIRCPRMGRIRLPEGYSYEEGTEALAACLAAEEERQSLEAKAAAAKILTPEGTYDA